MAQLSPVLGSEPLASLVLFFQVRTFVTLLIVATGTILCVLLCPRFCLQHCWLSFKPGEKQESSRLTTSRTRSFQSYSRVPDGKVSKVSLILFQADWGVLVVQARGQASG